MAVYPSRKVWEHIVRMVWLLLVVVAEEFCESKKEYWKSQDSYFLFFYRKIIGSRGGLVLLFCNKQAFIEDDISRVNVRRFLRTAESCRICHKGLVIASAEYGPPLANRENGQLLLYKAILQKEGVPDPWVCWKWHSPSHVGAIHSLTLTERLFLRPSRPRLT